MDGIWWQKQLDGGAIQLTTLQEGFRVCGGFALLGWRIARRYDKKGLIAFLILWSRWGYFHDVAGSSLFASSGLMVIGPGLVPSLADFLLYMTGMALSLSVVRWLGGEFKSDPLLGKRGKSD
jgi:hypothetical protein